MKQIKTRLDTPEIKADVVQKQTQTSDLKTRISSGNSTAKDNRIYNHATGNNTAARDLMLSSKEVVGGDKLNTQVSIEEAQKIKNAGITQTGENVTLTPEANKQAAEKLGKTVQPTAPTKPTDNKTEVPMLPQTIDDWKSKGSDMGTLEEMIEQKYGTVANNVNGKLTATIGDKNYEWSIDEAGNPAKKEVELTAGEKVLQSETSKYANATPDELLRALSAGNISPEVQANIATSPNFAIAKEKYQKKVSADRTNAQMLSMYNRQKGNVVEETKTQAVTIGENIYANKQAQGMSEDDIVSYKDFIAQDTEFTKEVKELNSKALQVRELNRAVEDNLESIEEEYPGMSKGSALLLNSKQTEGAIDQINVLNDEMLVLQSSVQYKEKILDRTYSDMQSANLRDEERAYNRAYELEQREYAYDSTYGDLDSQDLRLQDIALNNAVSELYQQYPLPGMETQSTKLAKVKDMIAQGMSPRDALNQVEQEIRGTKAYKNYAAQYNQDQVAETKIPSLEVLGQDSEGNDVKGYYNETTQSFQPLELNFDNVSKGNMNWISLPDGADAGVQCGVFARNCSGLGSTPGGNSLKARITAFKDQEVVAGGQVLFNGGGYDKTYGHVAFVESVNDDGSFNVVESNLEGGNKVSRRTIDVNDPAISGFYNDTPVANAQGKDNKDLFAYAETLTDSDRTKFLKERKIEDDYISYKAELGGENADFSDIKGMTDVNFADKTTEFKTKSFTFGSRMKESEDSIGEIEKKFGKWYSSADREWMGGKLPNNFKTEDRQKFEQAERNFINAVLRQESGAAIADSEFENAKKQYMPQPGDSRAVMEQKKENRAMAVENMYRNSGKDDKGRNIVDIYKNLNGEVNNGGNTDDPLEINTGAGNTNDPLGLGF